MPLIDVLFAIVICVVTRVATVPDLISIPVVARDTSVESAGTSDAPPLRIEIDETGQVTLNAEPVAREQLGALTREHLASASRQRTSHDAALQAQDSPLPGTVILHAHQELPYQIVFEIRDLLHREQIDVVEEGLAQTGHVVSSPELESQP